MTFSRFEKAAASVALLAAASPSYAYLDPGTGSMILQGLIAGLAVAGLTVKTYWYRLKGMFGKNQKQGEAEEAAVNREDGSS